LPEKLAIAALKAAVSLVDISLIHKLLDAGALPCAAARTMSSARSPRKLEFNFFERSMSAIQELFQVRHSGRSRQTNPQDVYHAVKLLTSTYSNFSYSYSSKELYKEALEKGFVEAINFMTSRYSDH
jgi:hypothetical protein